MVRRGSALADIGTDHAYLPAYLVKAGICPKAIAADLRKSPLENAAETVRIYGVQDCVTLRLSDGLDSVLPHEADDIVLAGMGGTLIAEILSRADWIKDSSKRIIAQPMTHSEDVRKFFGENGFKIIEENAYSDDGRDYICMCAEYTGLDEKRSGLYYLLGIHPIAGNGCSLNFAKKQINRIKTRAGALEKADIKNEEYAFLKEIINEFTEAPKWQE